MPEARSEQKRRLAKPARVHAASGDLDGIESAVTGRKGRKPIQIRRLGPPRPVPESSLPLRQRPPGRIRRGAFPPAARPGGGRPRSALRRREALPRASSAPRRRSRGTPGCARRSRRRRPFRASPLRAPGAPSPPPRRRNAPQRSRRLPALPERRPTRSGRSGPRGGCGKLRGRAADVALASRAQSNRPGRLGKGGASSSARSDRPGAASRFGPWRLTSLRPLRSNSPDQLAEWNRPKPLGGVLERAGKARRCGREGL